LFKGTPRAVPDIEQRREAIGGDDNKIVDSVFWYTKHVHYTLV
jgi:hypothetical protein